jgi:ferredoxin-NADP reductase/DMSO/TMAO reductase YedYZ heme-binding membrane subunit
MQLLLAAGAAGVLAVWFAATDRLVGAPTGEAITAFGRVTGLLGAYGALVVLLLMARIPALERTVGLVRLASWHRYVGTSTLVLILAHVVATAWGYAMVAESRLLDELWAMVTDLPGMVTATVGTGLLILVSVSSARAVRRRIPYGAWWLVHLTTYAAIVLGFSHQLDTGDDFFGRPTAAAIWKGVVVATLAAVAWWRVVRPLADAWARRTRVTAVELDGGGISVWLEGDGAARRHAAGGGFVLVRFLRRGLWTSARPYSITEVGEGDRIRLVIRRRPGRTSQRIAGLKPGTRAIVEGPFGDLDRVAVAPGEPVLLVGAGAGITPLCPIARSLAADGHDVVVVHRASAPDQQLCAADLRALAASGAVALHDVVGTRPELGNDPLEARALARLVPDLAERELVVCTPPDLTARLVRSAREAGISPERIHVGVFAL